MKKLYYSILLILIIIPVRSRSQSNILVSRTAQVSFFSSAPLEDIQGISTLGASAINISTGDIIFKVRINTFQFEKKLMQEHFNENYMESEKYPTSEFKGKISDVAKLRKEGRYVNLVSGTLNIHGVTKRYETSVEFLVKGGEITAKASFPIKLADHQIKIPSVAWKKIAETVKVNLSADFSGEAQ